MSADSETVKNLKAAAAAVLQECHSAVASHGDDLRSQKHVVSNKTMGQLRRALEDIADSEFSVVAEVFHGLVGGLYSDDSVPLDIADWLIDDAIQRFGGRRNTRYCHLVERHPEFCFRDIAENARAEHKGGVRSHPREVESPAHGSGGSEASPHTGSSEPFPTDSDDARKDKKSRRKERPEREEHPSSRSRGDGHEERQRPHWRVIVGKRREQLHRLAVLLGDLLAPRSEAEPQPSAISLKAVFDAAVSANIFSLAPWDETIERKLSRALFTICAKNQLASVDGLSIAVTKSDVINLKATRTGAEPRHSVVVDTSGCYDEAFNLLLHLLRRNFHFKGAPASKGGYPGHNICCVAIDPSGRYAGFDSNQCKADKNLCSHAEKRLAEAINVSLKDTTPDGKPPSLEGWTFISSLEPCHMCANFISRMGVRSIGFLMADPMQKDAIFTAADLLVLKLFRPKETAWPSELEAAFHGSGLPEEEITTWLGQQNCLDVLAKLTDGFPLSAQASAFFEAFGNMYPGCVLDSSSAAALASGLATPGMIPVARSTSSLLNEYDLLEGETENDDNGIL